MDRNVPASHLTSLPKGSPAREFPFLAYLLGGWFHQDYDYEGDDLEQILRNFAQTASPSEREETVNDIERFLTENSGDDQDFSVVFEEVFKPEVTVEGWDGMTTRQWLQKVADCLR